MEPDNYNDSADVADRPLVLVVEDHPDVRATLARVLEHHGYRVAVAPDGEEGVLLGLQLRPTAAVVDITLPKLDGYEVARRLKAAQDGAIRLAAYTSLNSPDDQREAREAGFDAHFVKPGSIQRLVAWLAEPRSP
jgi:CheY-like chemotaxis protein